MPAAGDSATHAILESGAPDGYHTKVLNKREFFRLKLAIPFSFTVSESREARIPTNQAFSYQTCDLSGGGLRMETDLPLQKGDRLQIKLMMPALEAIRITGRIVWSRRQRGREDDRFWVGVAFEGIPEDDQDRIVGFLFRAQIEERQRSRDSEARFGDSD